MPEDGTVPQFNLCERHPDCLFQGGCECKRQQIRERATEPQFNAPPRWTVDFDTEELVAIAADEDNWWSGVHRRQAAREVARRREMASGD